MKRITLATLALLLFVATALAQNPTGRLIGTVSDPSGVIPGATVVIRANDTGKERTVTTSDDGTFSVPQLEAGTYTVIISAQGHKTFTANEVKIDVSREYSLNPTLDVGSISENITVTAGADILNATSGEISNTVSPRQIQDLPLDGRDPLGLIQLQAGVAGNGATNTSINGQRPSATSITRDGINVQDQFIRESASDFSPQRSTTDNISEFTVTTSNAGADLGAGASFVQQITQRGTSEFHGAAWLYNRNSYFAANEFFNNASGVERPRLNRNQFGGKIGGPLPIFNFGEGNGPAFYRDKGFFFFNYEELRLPLGSSRPARTILLPQARQGIFTYIDNAGVTRQINILDPRFATGITTINPVIQSRILSRLPTTGNDTTVGDQLNTTGFRFNQADDTMRKQFDTRIDVDINDRNTINGVFVLVRDQNLRPDIDGTQGFDPTPIISNRSDNETLVLAWRTSPSASFTNEVRGGYFDSRVPFVRSEAPPAFFLTLPLVSNPEVSQLNQSRRSLNSNIQDNATYTRGDHSIKFGGLGQFIRVQSSGSSPDRSVPLFTVGTSLQTSITAGQFNDPVLFPGGISATQRTRANSLLALLGGIISSGVQDFSATREGGFAPGLQKTQELAYENYALYVQDQWRVTPRFTLNLGVRYELFTPVRDVNGSLLEVAIPEGTDPRAALLTDTGTIRFAGGNAGGGNKLFNMDKNNFAPNVSFAWSPQFKNKFMNSIFPGEGRTVLRGGFSITYFNDEYIKGSLTAAETTPGLSQTVSLPVLNARTDNVPAFPIPTLQIPRTFAQQRAQTGPFQFLFAQNPNLQVASSQQYNFGIQRELGWQTALEVRYVGGRSNNLTNIVDINQIDIFSNGFLRDFATAQQNLNLSRALNAQQAAAGVPAASRVRITGAFNPAVPGSTQFAGPFLQLGNAAPFGTAPIPGNPFGQLGGLDIAGIQNRLDRGVPAELALVFIANPPLQGSLRLLPNENVGQIGYLDNQAKYNYNSLQVELRRRFADGLYFQANYTFSKTLTNSSGLSQLRFDPLLDVRNPGLEYTRADYDQTHRFNFNSIYELPFGRGKRFFGSASGLVDRLLGGWQAGTIVTVGSGAPITIIDNRATLSINSGRQTPNSNLSGAQVRDLIGVFKTPCGVFFINPEAININRDALNAGRCNQVTGGNFSGRGVNEFGGPTFPGQVFFYAQPGETGNLPRAIANGPVYFNINASLLKTIRIKENFRVQLRGEVFNLLNRPNFFAGVTEDINSTTFGRVTDTFEPRIFQFAVRLEF
jgi:hypothetical protein